jgi:hypothetical protein
MGIVVGIFFALALLGAFALYRSNANRREAQPEGGIAMGEHELHPDFLKAGEIEHVAHLLHGADAGAGGGAALRQRHGDEEDANEGSPYHLMAHTPSPHQSPVVSYDADPLPVPELAVEPEIFVTVIPSPLHLPFEQQQPLPPPEHAHEMSAHEPDVLYKRPVPVASSVGVAGNHIVFNAERHLSPRPYCP